MTHLHSKNIYTTKTPHPQSANEHPENHPEPGAGRIFASWRGPVWRSSEDWRRKTGQTSFPYMVSRGIWIIVGFYLHFCWLPSGNLLHSYRKSAFSMRKSAINCNFP